ncbi:PTS transporter subunit EIIC [Winslowiella iniecta]|uniref:PTS system glucose-specific EIICB component n=1 Tax=Winslowiella iniecta TaxID=1560201 RepID=A0A0L7T4G6_9GAMM|nr:PTS transporter subunit EIIC [Winslowiella iniecta]KOC90299.1 hypothetical protein NG42_09540 [Winslowiella iniecta]KOC94739.1 hypothetical protein NG43_02800 [Winslowiella iniecta]
MNYKNIADQIVAAAGGNDNITSVTHCMTRLRFVIKNKSKVDEPTLRAVEGVLGVVDATGQLQIVLGKTLLPIYSEVEKAHQRNSGGVSDMPTADEEEPAKKFSIMGMLNDAIGFIASAVTPAVPGFIAGGMIMVGLLLATLIWPTFKQSSTYTMLFFLSQCAFYFMPIYVAYGAAKKLGSTPIFAMVSAAALIYPGFIERVASGHPTTLFGLPVLLDNYASTLLPALLIALVAAKLEVFFNKIIPGIFKAVFVGAFTVALTGTLGFVVLGPLGTWLGNYIVAFLVMIHSTIGPFALAVLTGAMPFLIIAGIHHLFSPIMLQSLSSSGYDSFFRPALILHNMAEGGACFGVAMRTQYRDLRSEAFSCGIGCIFAGVTEPAIYGITMRLKRPVYGVMAGGAVGGLVAGLMGAKAFMMGYSNLLSIPVFQDTLLAIISGVVATIVTSCMVTLILGFEDIER